MWCFFEDEIVMVLFYFDFFNGFIFGNFIIVGVFLIMWMLGEISLFKYDVVGNVCIVCDLGGYCIFYFYDNFCCKVGEVVVDGVVIEYKYDVVDCLIVIVCYVVVYLVVQVVGFCDVYGNFIVVIFVMIKLQIGISVVDCWEWNVYDKVGCLIEMINCVGVVVGFEYDGVGCVVCISCYVNVLVSGMVEGFVILLLMSMVYLVSYVGFDWVMCNFYDNDGLLIVMFDVEYYLIEYFYDKVGWQVEIVFYYGQFVMVYVFNGMLVQIKLIQLSYVNDVYNYIIYDGCGLVVVLIDGEGGVICFVYDVVGNVIQEVCGQKVVFNMVYMLVMLLVVLGQLQVVNYVCNVLGQVMSQSEVVLGGNFILMLVYGWVGDVIVVIDVCGNVINCYYDVCGCMVLEEVVVGVGVYVFSCYEYDLCGNLVKVIDVCGNVSYNYYDMCGWLVLVIDVEGYVM